MGDASTCSSTSRAARHGREFRAQLFEHIAERHFDADRLDRAGLEAADVEQGVEQARHALDGLLLLLQQLANVGLRDDLHHRGIEQANGLHRLAQVMACGRQEAALGTIGALRIHAGSNQLIVDDSAFSGIANGGGDEQLAADTERREPYASGKLDPVGTQREQIGDARTHLAVVRLAHVTRCVLAMMRTQARGNQSVERLADQRLGRVAEQLLDRLVRETNPIAVVDDDQGVGRKAEQMLRDLAKLFHCEFRPRPAGEGACPSIGIAARHRLRGRCRLCTRLPIIESRRVVRFAVG